jgi:hypothetical protein
MVGRFWVWALLQRRDSFLFGEGMFLCVREGQRVREERGGVFKE